MNETNSLIISEQRLMVYIENVQEKIKMSVLGHDDQKYPIQIESR